MDSGIVWLLSASSNPRLLSDPQTGEQDFMDNLMSFVRGSPAFRDCDCSGCRGRELSALGRASLRIVSHAITLASHEMVAITFATTPY